MLSFAQRYAEYQIPWGFSGLGEVTFLRTYSRTKDDGTLESWPEVIERVLTGVQEIGCNFTDDELERLGRYHLDLKCAVMSRGLWVFGTEMVRQFGSAALLNCYGTVIEQPSDFRWIMDQLMVGGGVGFTVLPSNTEKLGVVYGQASNVRHVTSVGSDVFMVPDTRQGWAECVQRAIEAVLYDRTFLYNTSLVRPAGTPLKTFGGYASGPIELVRAIADIADVLSARRSMHVRPIDALDCANIIGRCVVAGSARRSAQIAVGTITDEAFRTAKLWTAGVPAWRDKSNNSVVANSFDEIPDDYWTRYWDGSGELVGLLNMNTARTMGRWGEEADDSRIVTFNPCAEIGLEDKEACNLASIALPNVTDYDELLDIIQLLYRVQKHVALLPHPSPETEAVMHRNMRLGLSMSGILDATYEQREWLDDAYTELREYDVRYSEQVGVAPSIKLTSEKPDGTIALLFGVSSGINPNWSHRYCRRVRVSIHNPLVDNLRARGYNVQNDMGFDGSIVEDTLVVDFPVKLPDHAITSEQMSAVDHLNWVLWAQTVWADNAVSTTVTYRDEEIPAIREWMQANWHKMKCISWMRHSDHGFNLAPYETIDEDTYQAMVARLDTAAGVVAGGVEDLDVACAGGYCPVR